MTDAKSHIPEPLREFVDLGEPAEEALRAFDEAHAALERSRAKGKVLPGSIDALRVELTFHSNAIEGSTLTLRETQLVLEGLSPGGNKSLREIYEARNHDRALREIESWVASVMRVEVTERDMRDVHAFVLADIDAAQAGRLRSERVLIRGTRFIPPPSRRFEGLLPVVFGLANRGGVHPLVRAAELHYNIVAVHPFADGNGRTARLMMNYLALKHGLAHIVLEVERRGEYLAALEEANQGRCGAFATLVFDSARGSIERLIGSEE